ncbi:MAG: hypothetical protein K2H20_01000 [Bacilli bacterium]|nr:hypothetical protein [Bacilli bacterium]
MCLKTTTRGRNNPKTDIYCYKILIHHNGKILAPFTQYEYKLNETLCDTADENIKKERAYKLIYSGYFHACSTINSAKKLIEKTYMNKFPDKVFIHKAIIPCKTKYYIDDGENICAKSIKVLDEICV